MENEKILVQEFKKINLRELPDSTFLEIINKSHLENTWSRILAFYFDPNRNHKMKDFLIKSIFEAIGKQRVHHSFHSFKVRTECITKLANRIDIVIETNEFVIGIENKVNAPLYNDLMDYANTVKSLAITKDAYLVVLSKHEIELSIDQKEELLKQNIFLTNLTYEKFLHILKKNLGYYHSFADTKYFIFFLDFIDNIEKNLNMINMINNPEAMKFFIEKNEEIAKIVEKNSQIFRELNAVENVLHSMLVNDTGLQKSFREKLPNENFILEVLPIYRSNGENCLKVVIKLKEQNQQILDCNIYYHSDYQWYCDSNASEKYQSVFGNRFKETSFYFDELKPWIEVEELKKRVCNIILMSTEVVSQYEHEILAIQ